MASRAQTTATAAERGLAAHPQVAQRYRRAIRFIMVDEFQDTNQMQVSIIRRIAAPDLSNVCCMGDRQQSIYRFRGADAHVTGRFGGATGIPAGAENRLDHNYRCHADILAFVERVSCGRGAVLRRAGQATRRVRGEAPLYGRGAAQRTPGLQAAGREPPHGERRVQRAHSPQS